MTTNPNSACTLNTLGPTNTLGILFFFVISLLTGCGGGGGGSDKNPATETDPTENTAPSVDAGTDQSVTGGDSVQLNGSGSDVQGPVSFLWSQTSGTSVKLSDTTAATPSFVAPGISSTETLSFSLTVTDRGGLSASDSVTITVLDSSSSETVNNYLFYLSEDGELGAVDPTNPSAPILVNPDTIYGDLIETSSYSGTTKTTSHRRDYVFVYADTDGHLYKVYADRSSSPTPTQVSNESQAGLTCVHELTDSPGVADFLDPEASQFIYVLPGPDALCSTDDDVWKMVRLNMDSTASPMNAYHALASIMDTSSGEISGWLVNMGKTLGRCDSNFSNCTAITDYTLDVDLIAQSIDYLILNIDKKLYSYDIANSTLSAPLFEIPLTSGITQAIDDGTNVYFSHEKSLYALPFDGSSNANLLSTEANAITDVELAGSQVIIATVSTEIRAVPKTGGTSLLLASASGGNHLFVMSLSENYIYYNEQQFATSLSDPYLNIPVAAGIVATDGSSHMEYAGAAWSGETMKKTWDLTLGFSRSLLSDKIILAEGYDLDSASGGYAGATLTAFTAATGIAENVLGTIPTTAGVVSMFCMGYTKDALCEANIIRTPIPASPALPYQGDIFYIDSTGANSLTGSTATPSDHEIPANYL